MRKLMEAVKQLNEYGDPPPGNYLEFDASKLGPNEEETLYHGDWKDDSEEVLINVANNLLEFGLRIELFDFGDGGYHFRIVK